jgi:hypothetical protein
MWLPLPVVLSRAMSLGHRWIATAAGDLLEQPRSHDAHSRVHGWDMALRR